METHAVSVMTSKTLETVAEFRDEMDDRLLPHPSRRQSRLTVKKETKRKALTREVRLCGDIEIVKNPSCKFWHLPVCQNYKSERGCMYGDKCHFRRVEAEGKPSKKSKKGEGKGSVAILKGSIQLGCVSQDSHPSKSILRELGKLASKHAVKFSKGTWHQKKIGKERVHCEGLFRSVRLMSVVLARQKFEERSHEETLHQEGCARIAAWDLAKHFYKLKNSDKATL